MFTRETAALRSGAIAACLVMLLIYGGSQALKHFDWALTTYAVGTIFAAFAVAYRYAVWARRPPAQMYLKRGLELFLRRNSPPQLRRGKPRRSLGWGGVVQQNHWFDQHHPGAPVCWLSRHPSSTEEGNVVSIPRNIAVLGKLLLDNFLLQKFIRQRSTERWIMHACLSWGGMLAFALTFPLVFGWIHFESVTNDAQIYRVFIAGYPVEQFAVHSIRGFLHFNLLNLSAALMLIGLILSLRLRLNDRGEMAIQTFAEDVLPLVLLFAVSTTGLMLSISSNLMAGYGFQFVGMAHAASVIGLLLYLPFGKLFHIVQRPLSLAVSFYKQAGQSGLRAHCRRCGEDYGSLMHIEDLKVVLAQVGFNFNFATPDGEIHYQDICPPCRRRVLALNQGRTVGR